MNDAGCGIATRRGVIAGMAAALVGAATASPARALSPEAGPSAEIRRWTACVGETFGRAGGALRLVSVEPGRRGGHRPRSIAREQEFIAVFEAVGAAPAGEAISAVSHPSLGRSALFLGARQDVSGRARFVAAFN